MLTGKVSQVSDAPLDLGQEEISMHLSYAGTQKPLQTRELISSTYHTGETPLAHVGIAGRAPPQTCLS